MLARPMMIGEQQEDLAVDRPVAKKRVSLPATASLAHPRQFALREQTELPVVTELILRGIRFARHPGSEFRIFLERADDPSRRAFVGTLSFFSDEPMGAEAHHAPGDNDEFFDATEALRALQLEGTGTLELNVVIEAEDDDFKERSGLIIDAIELQVKRDL